MYSGKEPWNATVNTVGSQEVMSQNRRLVCGLHGAITVYLPQYPRIKMLLTLEASAFNLERTSLEEHQFILGEMGVSPKNG